MNINIEFFDSEPIENLITCLNFKIDKVIFFGYSDLMTEERMKTTRKVLKHTCGIEAAEFIEVSRKNLYKNVEAMERLLQKETAAGNQCFFDLTGGEDLILVAMGILSTKFDCPMHRFDVKTGKLRLMNKLEMPGIEELVEKRTIELTLDDVIGFHGGIINYQDQKAFKANLEDEEFFQDAKKMWEIASRDQRKWNGCSSVLKACTNYEDLYEGVYLHENELRSIVDKVSCMRPLDKFYAYMKHLCDIGMIRDFKTGRGYVSFTYKNESIREVLLDAGSLLEIMTYYSKKSTGKFSDCRIGVHIDWDGVISGSGQDVKNEIDVMLLEGHTPVFISCKNGKVDQMALYELDTVAKRFGGKYVKKELMVSQGIKEGYLLRAEEMEIDCITLKNSEK